MKWKSHNHLTSHPQIVDATIFLLPSATPTFMASSFCPKQALSFTNSTHQLHQSRAIPRDIHVRFPAPVSSPSSRCGLKSKATTRLKVLATSATKVMDHSSSKASSQAPTVVEVDLGTRSYPIYIGAGLLDQPDLLQRWLTCAIYCLNFIKLLRLYSYVFVFNNERKTFAFFSISLTDRENRATSNGILDDVKWN